MLSHERARKHTLIPCIQSYHTATPYRTAAPYHTARAHHTGTAYYRATAYHTTTACNTATAYYTTKGPMYRPCNLDLRVIWTHVCSELPISSMQLAPQVNVHHVICDISQTTNIGNNIGMPFGSTLGCNLVNTFGSIGRLCWQHVWRNFRRRTRQQHWQHLCG